jgi:hypothetical protein
MEMAGGTGPRAGRVHGRRDVRRALRLPAHRQGRRGPPCPLWKGVEPADQPEQHLPIEDGPKAKSLPRVLAVELREVGNSSERGSSV